MNCTRGVSDADGRRLHLENRTGFAWHSTLFAVERVTGIEPALSAWESDLDPCTVLR